MRTAFFISPLEALPDIFKHRHAGNIDSVAGLKLVIGRHIAQLKYLLVANGQDDPRTFAELWSSQNDLVFVGI